MRWLRKRERRDTKSDLQQAQESLKLSREAHEEQVRKRDREREALVRRLDHLAGEDSNHLGRLVLEALTERYGPPTGQGRESGQRA